MGHTSHGVTYYWNDSGAKQLNLPQAPYTTLMYQNKARSDDPILGEGQEKPAPSVPRGEQEQMKLAMKKNVLDALKLNGLDSWVAAMSNLSDGSNVSQNSRGKL